MIDDPLHRSTSQPLVPTAGRPRSSPWAVLGIVLVLGYACSSRSAPEVGRRSAEPDDIRYLWLEDRTSDTVLAWAEARRIDALEHFAAAPLHDSLVAEIRAARAASGVVPVGNVPAPPGVLTGDWANRIVRGVWLRQPIASYDAPPQAWTRILDLDSLSRAEGGQLVIASLDCLEPHYDRCLLYLARDGRRSVELREFDAGRREFIRDGFRLSEARTAAFSRDSSSIYITTGSGDDARIWRRGQPLDEADVIFRAGAGDRGLEFERRGSRLLLLHSYDEYAIDYYLVRNDTLLPLAVPRDVRRIDFVGGRMVLQLRSGWTPADVPFPPGSLIDIDLREFLAGSRSFAPIMSGGPDLVVDEIWTTRNLLLVRALADMKVQLLELAYRDGTWERRRIEIPETGDVVVRSLLPASDIYYFTHEDFLSPRRYFMRAASGDVELGGRITAAFPAEPYQVDYWHATSVDGTRIPYFVVHRKDMAFDGLNPVIVYGYGGNGISTLPDYLALYGPTWLRRGGVYVLANIRGGNEYGPEWHTAVRRENRQRAFDDFQAVARDLIDRKVTAPKLIGTSGGSNGGLLVGISYVQRPDLYGAVWANNGVLELQRCSSLSGDPPVGERGDGQNPGDWAYMRHYSPFHNLSGGKPYPPLLLTANRADDVVHPCHSRKFTARLEDLGYDNVHYYETATGGHGKSYSAEEEAMIISFFLRSLHPAYR